LDQTAFYPTSGGQLNDLGTLGGIPVVDVVDEDSRIAHVLAHALDAPTVVAGAIDWHRRFGHMQQHTGQHLLSAVFEDLFGMKTVSVHFGDSHSTLDLEADSLGADRLARVERRANEIIAENRAVTVSFEDAGSATGLRKAVDRAGTLRVISIDGLDRSACGGTHVRATGEIGCALLRGTERIRKTIRVEFLCGLRAVERARADYLALTGIASSLSAALNDVPTLVASQTLQLKESDQVRRKLEKELASHRAQGMFSGFSGSPSETRIAFHQAAAQTMEQLRILGQAVTDLHNSVLVATTAEGNGLLVAATDNSRVDAGKLVREALASVGGKGGGSPRLAQGTAPTPEQLDHAFRFIRDALKPDQ
jgi:alanyl-tRNA synthetase